ncbi:MAG: hypothetical protein LN414_07515 [Candidatus Thermoplasmatota archaeon]|nr:hypothetical protein [Candidatus Thermoplasmatota archaeon]
MTEREPLKEDHMCADVDPEHLVGEMGGYYRLIAELFNNPEDLDKAAILEQADRVLPSMERAVSPGTAALLRDFTVGVWTVGNDYYVDNLELDPTIPLYLGHYVFPEPKTCSDLGRSERNQYMIELVDLYQRCDLLTDGTELPDYLPLMVEFLWLSLEEGYHRIRHQVLSAYLLPVLPQLISRLEEEESLYQGLVTALKAVAEVDLACIEAGEEGSSGPEDGGARTTGTGVNGQGGMPV